MGVPSHQCFSAVRRKTAKVEVRRVFGSVPDRAHVADDLALLERVPLVQPSA